jgi:alkylation response protein AidB-like acyl-CoA dehydrogenase
VTTELLISRRDLEFMLYDWLDVVGLTRAERYADHSRETFDAVLDTSERLANERFAPHYQKSDRNEPQFDGERVTLIDDIAQALQAFADAGLPAAIQDYDRGGMQLPTVVEKAAWSYLCAANISTCAYPLLAMANARLLLRHGNPAQIATFAEPQLQGRWYGTMCLSEPQAGSSLADVATRADYEGESSFGAQYRVSGNKMWISAGDHELGGNIVHLVLARIPGEDGQPIPGVKGLSLLLVPKFLVGDDGNLGQRNDVSVAGINHKMGYRGAVNCALNFGEGTTHRPGGRAGAVGYLVGPLHGGLGCMFHMMNEARIGIGLGAASLAYTAYLHALDYARHRPQGRAAGSHSRAQEPIIMHADVRRMLLAQKAFAEGALGLNLYCARLVDEARVAAGDAERASLLQLLELLTPIAKSWPSQWCLAANDLAIQVHGGYGYTREYKVEQLYRDNRLNPIHEGTHGIQALDLLGRKVTMDNGAALLQFAGRVEGIVARARECEELVDHADALHIQMQRLLQVTRILWAAGDPVRTLANASVYLEAFGHIAMAWIWLQQALAAHGKATDFHHGKRQAAGYFFAWELPKVSAQLDLLARLDRSALDMRDAWF